MSSKDEIRKALSVLELEYLSGNIDRSTITSARISADLLEKGGKRAQLGEIREFKGKKYKKTVNGWRPVPKGRPTGEPKELGVGKEKTKQLSGQDVGILFGQAQKGTLPQNFDQWDLADQTGWTVAHEAARHGHLPSNFDHWDLKDKHDRTVAHVAVRQGHLPLDFNQWDLADEAGRTVAHEAAYYGRLPQDFDQWELKNRKGQTVAHLAAYYGYLPPDFNQWDLADNNGKTVARVAGESGHPADVTFYIIEEGGKVTIDTLDPDTEHKLFREGDKVKFSTSGGKTMTGVVGKEIGDDIHEVIVDK